MPFNTLLEAFDGEKNISLDKLAALAELEKTIDFKNLILDRIDWSEQDLEGFNFSGTCFRGSNFSEAKIYETSFEGCNLDAARFENSIFKRANFDGSSVFSCVFQVCETVRRNVQKTKCDWLQFLERQS